VAQQAGRPVASAPALHAAAGRGRARTDSKVAVHIYKLLIGFQQAVDELGDAEQLHLPRGSARISRATSLACSQAE